MAATITLEQLLTAQTSQQIFDLLISVYQSVGFPVTAWQLGGMERTRLAAISTTMADQITNQIPILAASGFVDFAQQLPGQWLPMLAQELYNLQQLPAQFADGYILLTNATSSTININSNQLIAVFPSGNRYFNLISGTLPSLGTLSLPFQSEFAQNTAGGLNYNQDETNTAGLLLATPLPGVSITNPAATFTTPTHTGASLGTLTPSGGSGGDFHYIIVTVVVNGNITSQSAEFNYSLDGSTALPVALSYSGQTGSMAIPGTGSPGVTITLSDDGYGALNTTFYVNDTYQFQTPGSWLYQQGIDVETNPHLAQRCKDQWNTLSQVPTQGFYEYIVSSATSTDFPQLGAQATNILVITDGYINNKVDIVVAGPNGPLSPVVVTQLQAYVNTFAPITDLPVILSPTTETITLAGNITIFQALNAPPANVIAAAINVAIINYIETVGINGIIKIAEIIDIVMNQVGVLNITGLTINGSSVDVSLGSIGNFIIGIISASTINFVYTIGSI